MSVKKEQLPRRMHTVHVYESRGEWLFQGIIVFIMVVMSLMRVYCMIVVVVFRVFIMMVMMSCWALKVFSTWRGAPK